MDWWYYTPKGEHIFNTFFTFFAFLAITLYILVRNWLSESLSLLISAVGTYIFGWVPAFLLTLLILILTIYVAAEEKTTKDIERAKPKYQKTMTLKDLEIILQE